MDKQPLKRIILLVFIVLIIIGLYFMLKIGFDFGKPDSKYLLSSIKQGSFTKTIAATGTINPRRIVSVGTQVSGIIEKVYVNENSAVEKGMLIAKLDKRIFQNNVDRNRALLHKLKARHALIKKRLKRMYELRKKDFISHDEIDELETELKIVQADYALAEADLEKSLLEIQYTDIHSPVDGIVMEKFVEPGQTVAASFNTPVLFKIAENMKDMKITVKIAESDILLISKNQKVLFTVSSLADKTFEGSVEKIMFNPNIQQGVVTYDVIISANNEDLLLRPGMSARLDIEVERVDNANYVPTNALRFTPHGVKKNKHDAPHVYILENGTIVPVSVEVGIENNENTQILKGNIEANQKIIVGRDTDDAD